MTSDPNAAYGVVETGEGQSSRTLYTLNLGPSGTSIPQGFPANLPVQCLLMSGPDTDNPGVPM